MQHFSKNVAWGSDTSERYQKVPVHCGLTRRLVMLNLTVKPGEYFMIGDEIKVAFVGGTANNARILIDAPRKYNIVRGKVLERAAADRGENVSGKHEFYPEVPIPAERLKQIIAKQKKQKERKE